MSEETTDADSARYAVVFKFRQAQPGEKASVLGVIVDGGASQEFMLPTEGGLVPDMTLPCVSFASWLSRNWEPLLHMWKTEHMLAIARMEQSAEIRGLREQLKAHSGPKLVGADGRPLS